MLSDRKYTSDETDADTEYQSDRNKYNKHVINRKQSLNEIREQGEPGHDIFGSPLIKEIKCKKRDSRADDTDDNTFQHEGHPDEQVRRSYIFHDRDLFAPYRDTRSDGI